MCHLALFSYVIMSDLHSITEQSSPNIAEYVLWGWTTTIIMEEIRQVCDTSGLNQPYLAGTLVYNVLIHAQCTGF